MSKLIVKKDDNILHIVDENSVYDCFDTVTLTVTYTDDSTEDIDFVIMPNSQGE